VFKEFVNPLLNFDGVVMAKAPFPTSISFYHSLNPSEYINSRVECTMLFIFMCIDKSRVTTWECNPYLVFYVSVVFPKMAI
jgi:hypothetical protein